MAWGTQTNLRRRAAYASTVTYRCAAGGQFITSDLCRVVGVAKPLSSSIAVVTMVLATDIAKIGTDGTLIRLQFKTEFVLDVAARLRISADRIAIVSISAGSVKVVFSILSMPNQIPISSAAIIAAFSAPGLVIARTKTAVAITAASIQIQSNPPPPPQQPLTPPPPPPFPTTTSLGSSHKVKEEEGELLSNPIFWIGVSLAAAIIIVVVVVVVKCKSSKSDHTPLATDEPEDVPRASNEHADRTNLLPRTFSSSV
jgi:hypothetical protein